MLIIRNNLCRRPTGHGSKILLFHGTWPPETRFGDLPRRIDFHGPSQERFRGGDLRAEGGSRTCQGLLQETFLSHDGGSWGAYQKGG